MVRQKTEEDTKVLHDWVPDLDIVTVRFLETEEAVGFTNVTILYEFVRSFVLAPDLLIP